MNAKQKILLLTYAKFAYMQNLRICKSLPCVQGLSLTKHSKNKDVKGKNHCSLIRTAIRIISLCRFWAVNTDARFCHVQAQMIMMNEMIL